MRLVWVVTQFEKIKSMLVWVVTQLEKIKSMLVWVVTQLKKIKSMFVWVVTQLKKIKSMFALTLLMSRIDKQSLKEISVSEQWRQSDSALLHKSEDFAAMTYVVSISWYF